MCCLLRCRYLRHCKKKMNRFITESEVEEAKKKRAEEWEEARAAGREVPDLDEPIDTRSLYERLKEQKDKKQEVFEEQFKFKNMIYKGLNDEDASFLGMVAKKQAEIDDKRFDDESEEIQQYRAAVEEVSTVNVPTEKNTEEKQCKPNSESKIKKNTKSQAAILSGVIRKKRKSDMNEVDSASKKSKEECEEEIIAVTKNENKIKDQESAENTASVSKSSVVTTISKNSLSTLADYSSSSSEEEGADGND